MVHQVLGINWLFPCYGNIKNALWLSAVQNRPHSIEGAIVDPKWQRNFNCTDDVCWPFLWCSTIEIQSLLHLLSISPHFHIKPFFPPKKLSYLIQRHLEGTLHFHKGSQSTAADELWIYTELIVQCLSHVDKPLVHFSLIHFERELS